MNAWQWLIFVVIIFSVFLVALQSWNRDTKGALMIVILILFLAFLFMIVG